MVPLPVDIGNDFANERWIKVKGFPEVPMSILDFSKWKTIYSGPWRYEDNILLLEAKALEKTVRRIGMSQPVVNMRVLVFW